MRIDELINGLAEALANHGDFEARFPYEPGPLGNDFPAITVRYIDDSGDGGGSDEDILPGRVTFAVRVYYPIFDTGDGEDGLKVAQDQCLSSRGIWMESLAEDRSLDGLAYNVEILGGRAFGLEDPDHGNVYVHETTLNAYIN